MLNWGDYLGGNFRAAKAAFLLHGSFADGEVFRVVFGMFSGVLHTAGYVYFGAVL